MTSIAWVSCFLVKMVWLDPESNNRTSFVKLLTPTSKNVRRKYNLKGEKSVKKVDTDITCLIDSRTLLLLKRQF